MHLAAMASPGPNVLLVARTSIAESRRDGVYAAIGIATGAACWAIAAAVGLAVAFDHVAVLYDAVRVLGGLYLVYLGVRTFRAASSSLFLAEDRPRSSARTHWVRGALTNFSNPKALVFYASIFATLIPRHASPAERAAAVAVILVNALWWHGLLAAVFSTRQARGGYLRGKRWIDRAAGTLMAGFGVAFLANLR